MRLRRATPDDAQALSALAGTCFTQTFGHLYPPQDLEAFLHEAYAAPAWASLLSDPGYATWLLEDGDTAIGYATAGDCALPHPDVASGDGELKRLYVLQGRQGGGNGSRLFDAAMQWLLRDGPRTLWIGVWSENFGAQRFYARHGFEHVGAYDFIVGQTRDHEFILKRSPASP